MTTPPASPSPVRRGVPPAVETGLSPRMPWQAAVALPFTLLTVLFGLTGGLFAVLAGFVSIFLLCAAEKPYKARAYRYSLKTQWAILIVGGVIFLLTLYRRATGSL